MISQRKRIKAVIREYEVSAIDPRTAITAIGTIINEKSLVPKKSADEKSALAFRTLMRDKGNDAVLLLHNGGKCMHTHINSEHPIVGLTDLIEKLNALLEQAKKDVI